MTMKEWEEPNWRSPILPIFKLKSPTPTQVGGVELFKTVKQESWGWEVQTGYPLAQSWSSRSPHITLPQVRGSPGSSNTSVQMNVQVLCREPGRGLGYPSPLPWTMSRTTGRPMAPTPCNSCHFQ